ncbi:hypothetical protein B0H13DRAFT_1853815 [Mycena leptocephala]|nr:hypothetical protein B0H13DRAFT_1853815 [Mycena leptocephala]
MPPQPTVATIRLNNIITCLNLTICTLETLASSLKSPLLTAMANTTQSLLKNMQTVKQNKNECSQLMEQTYELLNAILIVHIKSDTGGELPPSVLTHIGKFTESTEWQQDQEVFRQGEMSTLLNDCKAGLQQGFEFFQVSMVNHMKDITQMQEDAEKRNTEVLAMIEALSDTTSSDRSSSISGLYSGSHNSSNPISMLPSEPKIFHGRDSELSNIFQLFGRGTPRIAILGAGGMGKTSLAKAMIHHREITERYNQHRFFVACDSAATQVELAALIGAHVGLKPGRDLTRPVIQYFSSSSNSLLILDNLGTVWEPSESRGKIEEFLSLLTGVGHLALLITMRGAERPTKVAWTHPFLPQLKPLEQAAARQTFIDIADNRHDPKEVDKVLSVTDNFPLAISLIAHLVDSEGCSHVLSRWYPNELKGNTLVTNHKNHCGNLTKLSPTWQSPQKPREFPQLQNKDIPLGPQKSLTNPITLHECLEEKQIPEDMGEEERMPEDMEELQDMEEEEERMPEDMEELQDMEEERIPEDLEEERMPEDLEELQDMEEERIPEDLEEERMPEDLEELQDMEEERIPEDLEEERMPEKLKQLQIPSQSRRPVVPIKLASNHHAN